MGYLSSHGHDWSDKYNYDGLGISYLVFAVVYSIIFYTMCGIVWYYRKHPIIRMRNIGLALSSLLILHVYLFMIFLAYPLNGHYSCNFEFWIMSIYLPIGIGLFQAQNQQLLMVSRGQNRLIVTDELYKPLPPQGRGAETWVFRLKQWWQSFSEQGKYEGFVAVGIVVQLILTTIIFGISRQFSTSGVVGMHVDAGSCRRGWEWIPSILWQFIWNYFCGPLLLWKIRMIRDIYHWRLQTILCIVAGLPGSPMWLISTYSNSFASLGKYWIAPMWFLPGLITMEMVTLIFPIYQVFRHKKAARETSRVIAEWEVSKRSAVSTDGSIITKGSRGRMASMATLEDCLQSNYTGLQIYASTCELNGENIVFLVRVLTFKRQWCSAFAKTGIDTEKARMTMFRAALSIYVSLVHDGTSSYPINVESFIYTALHHIFGPATILVASKRPAIPQSPISVVTPWDEPVSNPFDSLPSSNPFDSHPSHPSNTSNTSETGLVEYFKMDTLATPPARRSFDNGSAEHIISLDEVDPNDPLADFKIPAEFDITVFDAAEKSIKYMVWTETWQRYCEWAKTSPISSS